MGESSELFVNCLEAMVETCLPIEDATGSHVTPRTHNLSCSLSSLTLNSPTDKGKWFSSTFFTFERYRNRSGDYLKIQASSKINETQ